MKTIDQWLTEYGESHQNKTNKLIHWVCVPAILFTVLGLLASIPTVNLFNWVPTQLSVVANWAGVVLVLASLFYLRLSFAMFLGMALISVAMLFGVREIAKIPLAPLWLTCLVIFVVAWIGQFIGHKIEGKKPSFFKDLQFLLIGPAWLLGFIYRKLGVKY
ncbi:MAG: DUF962 domain-containing protein [Spirochaetes bacterium]|nr:DUF962 domain-containing protein [Spirochaetota bacterium]